MNEKRFVCNRDKVKSGKPFIMNLAPDEQIAIFYAAGQYFALENRCPHAGAFLHEGIVEGTVLTCHWHGWRFDLQTGRSLTEYWASVKTYPVHLLDEKIYISPD
jgi:nitrite reductase/ring-hydroxylating ferredoxin subunit